VQTGAIENFWFEPGFYPNLIAFIRANPLPDADLNCFGMSFRYAERFLAADLPVVLCEGVYLGDAWRGDYPSTIESLGMSNISQSIIGWLLVGTSSIQPQRSGSPIHAKNGLRSPDVGASLEFWSGSQTLNVQRVMRRVALLWIGPDVFGSILLRRAKPSAL